MITQLLTGEDYVWILQNSHIIQNKVIPFLLLCFVHTHCH